MDLGKSWQAPRDSSWHPLRNTLLIAAVLVFLLDALATRLGWQRW